MTATIDPGKVADAAIEAEWVAGNAGTGGGTEGDPHIAVPDLPVLAVPVPVHAPAERELIPGAVADAAIQAEFEAGNAGNGGGTGGDEHIAAPGGK